MYQKTILCINIKLYRFHISMSCPLTVDSTAAKSIPFVTIEK